MNKRSYESVVLLNASLEDELINNTISRIKETIRVNGGEIFDEESWGRKRLAYPIEKAKSGYYYIFRFLSPTDLVAKLERLYQLDEYILRYLTVVLDKEALIHLEKAKASREQQTQPETGTEEIKEPVTPEKTNDSKDL